MKRRKSYALALLTTAALVYLPAVSTADELSYELRAGVGYSDNIARLPADEIDESIALVGIELAYERESRGFEAVVDADVEYRDYQDNTFDGETIGSVNADLQFNIVPDAFTWIVADRFGHTQSDPFQPQTPENRETINRLSTGPDFRLTIGSATAIDLSGRLSVNTFSESDIDNDALGGRLSFVRALSRARQLSLNVTADRVEFDNTLINSNFDRQAVYVGYTSDTSRSSLELNLGYNELHDFGDTQDGNLIEFSFRRDLTAATSFTLTYDQRLTDANDLFSDFQTTGQGFSDARDVSGVGDPLEIQRVAVDFEFARNRTTYTFSMASEDDDFLTGNNLDRRRTEVRLRGNWPIGERWNASISGGLSKTDFDVVDRTDDDLSVRGQLSMQLSRTLSLVLDLNHIDRESSNVLSDYVENQAFLTLRYGP